MFIQLNDIDAFPKSDFKELGINMYELIKELYPICRSITGNGVRQTLDIIKKHIPLEIHEIPSGTNVFDWSIPKEWNIKDAYVKNSKGEKIIDFNKSNLHVLNYSIPINKKISLNELKNHLFTLPDYPDWIPYRTSYYKDNWGFCLTHNQYENLKEDEYEVVIESALIDGYLTFGELLLKGENEEEVLFSCYVCHPSMCNDNLSGVSLLTFLAKYLMNKKLKYSYRFLFIPETIGAITWLSINEKKVEKIQHGLVATCLGDQGCLTYKKTRRGDAIIDRIVEKVLNDSCDEFQIIDFFPSGSDERQFSSPGFNLPIGSLTRTVYDKYPEYHTSADNLNFVKPDYLQDSFEKYVKVVSALENDYEQSQIEINRKNQKLSESYLIRSKAGKEDELIFENLYPKCEPNLGKRGLYDMIGGMKEKLDYKMPIFWILNLSDGKNNLLDISKRSKINFERIKNASKLLVEKGLIKPVHDNL